MKERQIWRQVTKKNLPFRDHRENVYSSNKGNFIKLVELMSKYDPVLEKHYLKEVNDNRQYLSSKIQNDFIHILGNCVQENTLFRIRKANYFAIICQTFLILIRLVSFVDMLFLKKRKQRCRNHLLVLSLSMGRQLMISRRSFWIDWRKRNLIFKNVER